MLLFSGTTTAKNGEGTKDNDPPADIYTVERLPIKNQPVTADRASKLSFTAQIDETRDYADDCIIVIIAHEYSVPNQLFGTKSFPELDVESVRDLTYFEDIGNEKAMDLVNMDSFRQILKVNIRSRGKDAVKQAISKLESRPEIRYAGPCYQYEVYPCAAPNEFNFMTTDQKSALNLINAQAAWDITTGSSNVKVGILDDGFFDHPDYRDNRAAKRNFTVTPNTTDVEDPNSFHGTRMAGIIGARGNNNLGTTGVCWNVSMYFAKMVTVTMVSGERVYGTNDGWVVDAFTWFSNQGVSIVNWSWTWPATQTIKDAIAMYNGLLCISAGNSGANIGGHSTNAGINRLPNENIICVASLTKDGLNLRPDSNYNVISVDLAGPGTDTYTTSGASGYILANGQTSRATAYVAGVAALIKSASPDYTTAQIKAAILDNVDVCDGLVGYVSTGGRLNAYHAIPLQEKLGDADGNGAVNAQDAAHILRHLVRLANITHPALLLNADANLDGKVNAADAAAILRYLVRLDTLPPGGSRASAPGGSRNPSSPPRSLPEYTLSGTPSLIMDNGVQYLEYEVHLRDISGLRLSALQFKVDWDPSKLTFASASYVLGLGEENVLNGGSYLLAAASSRGTNLSNINGRVARIRFTINSGVSPQDVLWIAFSDVDLRLVAVQGDDEVLVDPATYIFRTQNAFFYPNCTWAPTYSLVEDVSQAVGGKYVMVGTVQNTTNCFAMNNSMTFNKMGISGVTIVDDQVIAPPANAIWLLQEQSVPRRFSIRNAANSKYLNIVNNTVEGFTWANTPEYFFDLTSKAGDAGDARLATTALGNRCISIYQADFRSYTPANCRKLQLYKEDAAPGQPTYTPMPTASPVPTPTPPPNDLYQRVYTVGQVTDGDYLLVGANSATKYALSSRLSGGRMEATVVTEVNEQIRTTDQSLIWTFQDLGSGSFSLRSKGSNKYLNIEGNNTSGFTLTNAPTYLFQLSAAPGNGESFYLKTTAVGNRLISIYQVDFRSYLPADYRPLLLYKKVV